MNVMPMTRHVFLKKLPLAIPVLFLTVLYFYPLSQIFKISFRPEDTWNLTGFSKLFSQTYYAHILWFTFWQAALSTVLTLFLALPISYVLARFEFRARKLVTALVMVPFVLPTVVVATAFDTLTGSHSLIQLLLTRIFGSDASFFNLTHSVTAILLAHVFYNTSVAVRIISGFWAHMPVSMEETARMLGASPIRTFRHITLPLLRPAIISASLLVFLFCFSSFGVILILGGPRYATLEVEIYRQALHLFNLPMAATLSFVQIAFTLLLMGIYTHLQRRRDVTLMPTAAVLNRRSPQSNIQKLSLIAVIVLVIIFFGLPLFVLLMTSFWTGDGFSLTYYRALFINTSQSIFFIPPIAAMANSMLIAAITVVIATILGLCAANYLSGTRSRLAGMMDPVFMLPLSTSAVTLGFGFIIALDKPPLNLRASFWIVPLAHSLVAFPFVVRSVLPALRSIPSTLQETAQILGANPWRVFKTVDFPIIRRALVVGAVFAFTVSLGEFGATAFVARPQNATLPLAIYRFLGQPGGALNYGQALAMSSILMTTTTVGFFLLEHFRSSTTGEF